MWQVFFHPEAEAELNRLSTREKVALLNAVEKLRVLGPTLPFPHQSDVRGVEDLRELRPRAGRSAWRGFYRRVGDVFVLAAIGAEAQTDKRGFEHATQAAVIRLDAIQGEGEQL